MPSVFDIAELFQQAFNTGRGYDRDRITKGELDQVDQAEYDLQSATAQDSEFVNVRRVLAQKDALGRDLFMPVKIGNLILPNEPTLRITGRNEIVRTRLTGSTRKGTVKEFIAEDDYAILIRGLLINESSSKDYPEDDFTNLMEVINTKESLPIVSAITRLMGIERVVIDSFDFPEMIGIQHAQAYELRCYSDQDFILEID